MDGWMDLFRVVKSLSFFFGDGGREGGRHTHTHTDTAPPLSSLKDESLRRIVTYCVCVR